MATDKEDDFMALPLKPSASHKMTAAELCDNDDLLTSLLLDPVMQFQTHKMRVPYEPPSDEQKVKARAIVAEYVLGGDMAKSLKDLLDLEVVQSHLRPKTLQQKKDFRDHLMRFTQVYNENSGFTLLPCDRYASENKQGAKLVATRHWRKGTVISGLVGVIAEMTLAEEKEILKKDVNDFSVMHNTKRQRPQLWLGPVAFMNHDCRANCKFVRKARNNTAEYEICRDVAPLEELTLFYGSNYFGKGNKECECHTCEREGKGNFASRRTPASVRTSVLLTAPGTKYALRQTAVRQDRATHSASPPSTENASSKCNGKPREPSVFHSLLLPLLNSPSHEASAARGHSGCPPPTDSSEATSASKAHVPDFDVQNRVTGGDNDFAVCDLSMLRLVECDPSLDDRHAQGLRITPTRFYAGVYGPETIAWCHI